MENDPEIDELREKTKDIVKQITRNNNPWRISSKAELAKRLAYASYSTRTGMYARVPLVCKAENCPYADQCQLLPYGMAPEGEYCAVELAQIDIRAMGYANDIEYDNSSFTDKNLMSELITLDIMLERCKALMAKDMTPVVDVAIGVDNDGNEIRQPAVSKSWEAYEKISKKRDQVYQLMMMTRKDKSSKAENKEMQDVSSILKDVINTIDVDAK